MFCYFVTTQIIENSLCVLTVCLWCSIADESTLSLHVSSTDSDSESAATVSQVDLSDRRTGRFCCKVPDCASVFRRACQLSIHYTSFHSCDFRPPNDKHDLDLYNRCMSLCLRPATSGKRKRSPAAKQRGRSKPKRARTRTKSGYVKY